MGTKKNNIIKKNIIINKQHRKQNNTRIHWNKLTEAMNDWRLGLHPKNSHL